MLEVTLNVELAKDGPALSAQEKNVELLEK